MPTSVHKLTAHQPKGKNKALPEYQSSKQAQIYRDRAQAKRDRRKGKRVKDREDYKRALARQDTVEPIEAKFTEARNSLELPNPIIDPPISIDEIKALMNQA